jgi:hypothetical protein
MNRSAVSRLFGLVTLLAFCGAFTPRSAQALFLKKTLKKVKKVTQAVKEKVKGGVADAAKKVKEGAGNVAGKVKDAVTGAAKKVVEVVLKGKDKLTKFFSKESLAKIASGIKERIEAAADQIKDKIKKGFTWATNYAKTLAAKIFLERAKKAYAAVKEKIETQLGLLRQIVKDADAKKKLETLFKKAAAGKIDDELRTIAKWFAQKIANVKIAQAPGRRSAVAACGYPSFPKSFSLTIGVQVSGITPKIVGGMVEGRFGIVADLGKEPGKNYDARAYVHVAAGIGGGVPGVDASANIMLGLSPLKTENASGGFFGLFIEGGAKVGVEVEVEWGFVDGKIEPKPGFGVAVGVQDPSPGGAVMLNGGYAFTLGPKGWDY